jgi:xylulokinase
MTVSLGTSGTLFASADRPVVDPAGTLAAFCSSTGGWLPLLCTMNCTVSTELTRRLLALDTAALEHHAAAASVGSQGVMTLPFFNGERSPNLPQAKGCVLGLDDGNYSRDNLVRSAMESSVYGLLMGLDALRAQGREVTTLRLTGGGAGSASWRQMVADIFNVPVSVQTVDEGAALGAALQAAWMVQRASESQRASQGASQDAQGDAAGLQRMVDEQLELDPARACEPRADAVAAYVEHYRSYQRHVEAIGALYGQ